jgi:hypothetical protein
MMPPRDVTALMRREFASSKLCWTVLLALQVVAVVTSIVSLLVGDRAAPFLAGAASLCRYSPRLLEAALAHIRGAARR